MSIYMSRAELEEISEGLTTTRTEKRRALTKPEQELFLDYSEEYTGSTVLVSDICGYGWNGIACRRIDRTQVV